MNVSALDRFACLVGGADEDIDLVEGALLIAANEYPQLDVAACRRRLDDMAGELQARAAGSRDTDRLIRVLNHYLYDELGFAGNLSNFNDPRNSFLNDVLDRRLGIPITLSLLYMELGNRVGLDVRGLSFPGHFLVKVPAEDGDRVVDAFSTGLLLDDEELRQRLRHFTGPGRGEPDLDQYLIPAGKRQILARMLRNLKNLYFEAEDYRRALAIMNFLLVLSPQSVPEIRDRAYVHDQLECFRAAIDDYQQYLMLSPQAHDAGYIQSRLADLKQSASRLH